MTSPIRVLIVDDEAHARDTLRLRLAGERGFRVVGEARTGGEALEALDELEPDVVFLDVRMPGLSGFDVVERLDPVDMPLVVFVTAHEEYALRAFRANALAYLLKPFDDVRFAEAMGHVRRLLLEPREEARARITELAGLLGTGGPESAPVSRLVVKTGPRTRLIPVEDVHWVEAAGNYVRVHCGDESHLLSRTLTDLAAALDPSRFVRVHRSALVNVARIRELETRDHRDYEIVLEEGTRVRMSRTYRPRLEAVLGGPI